MEATTIASTNFLPMLQCIQLLFNLYLQASVTVYLCNQLIGYFETSKSTLLILAIQHAAPIALKISFIVL